MVAEAPLAAPDVAEDVRVDRLKLPEQVATVKLEDYLVHDDIREGYLRPSSLTAEEPQLFTGRACDRVRPAEFSGFLRALDRCGMLAAVRTPLGPRSGFLGVRKSWDNERQLWILRLVMDRRPRNAKERKLVPAEDTTPHSTCFTDIVLEPAYVLRLWSTDLPQYYYRMAISEERARSNVFTAPMNADEFKDTTAVRRLLEREGFSADSDVGEVYFGLATMAMGDVNATTFGQQGHVTLFRQHGAMKQEEMLTYRCAPPRGPVYEGVVIDDHCVVAQVPKTKRWRRSKAYMRAVELHGAAQMAYASIGVEDVEEKRQSGALTAVARGCEIQGLRGRAGSPRPRRAALAALTIALCSLGVATVELLQRIVGLWVDVLLYRRAGVCSVAGQVRILPALQE